MNNPTHLPGEKPERAPSCYGCKHLRYSQEQDAGEYHCASTVFALISSAREHPTPLEDDCKETEDRP